MSSGEAEYIAAAVACMRASHIRILIYDLQYLDSEEYNPDEPTCEQTAGRRHVARRYHYVRQGTTLKEHVFEWISTKYQLADPLTKPGTPSTFGHLWSILLTEIDTDN